MEQLVWDRAPARFDLPGGDLGIGLGACASALLADGNEGPERRMRVAARTDEILRNIIAERVLALPGDVRVDRDVPFHEVPVGS